MGSQSRINEAERFTCLAFMTARFFGAFHTQKPVEACTLVASAKNSSVRFVFSMSDHDAFETKSSPATTKRGVDPIPSPAYRESLLVFSLLS